MVQWQEYIQTDNRVLAGKATIKGTRLSVQFIVGLLANGMTFTDIMTEYNYITQQDIQACLAFAAQTLDEIIFMPVTQSA
jgi:uncharacterized protein (DUF433 family)